MDSMTKVAGSLGYGEASRDFGELASEAAIDLLGTRVPRSAAVMTATLWENAYTKVEKHLIEEKHNSRPDAAAAVTVFIAALGNDSATPAGPSAGRRFPHALISPDLSNPSTGPIQRNRSRRQNFELPTVDLLSSDGEDASADRHTDSNRRSKEPDVIDLDEDDDVVEPAFEDMPIPKAGNVHGIFVGAFCRGQLNDHKTPADFARVGLKLSWTLKEFKSAQVYTEGAKGSAIIAVSRTLWGDLNHGFKAEMKASGNEDKFLSVATKILFRRSRQDGVLLRKAATRDTCRSKQLVADLLRSHPEISALHELPRELGTVQTPSADAKAELAAGMEEAGELAEEFTG